MKIGSRRYQKNFEALKLEEQQLLQAARVAIVGCGGLGGYFAEEFARLGVGHLILIDADRLEETNLNRQLFALENNLGKLKIEAARERLAQVNSALQITTHNQRLTEQTGKSLLSGVDLVCDALDNAQSRVELERVCHDLDIPLVLAAIGGWQGLTALSYPGDRIAEKIYGQQPKPIDQSQGNPAFSPATIASIAVAESVKILTGRPVSLRHRILYIDLLKMEFELVNI